jgi:two-component system, OmpR family, response regulator
MANAPHILIVDDDRQIRASVARFLTANGFRISAAEDGATMFAAIEKGRFDLVVLDIRCPVKTD